MPVLAGITQSLQGNEGIIERKNSFQKICVFWNRQRNNTLLQYILPFVDVVRQRFKIVVRLLHTVVKNVFQCFSGCAVFLYPLSKMVHNKIKRDSIIRTLSFMRQGEKRRNLERVVNT